eukprot:gnl/TRDRNA2_/TRDRNA2_176551_c0_seq2.p1 gnl/TRDRNA2_/TRDRNA2_176551_c0~~gnl/TRDRNA2_/TRDRNA2_176551_c0_seq2.p1  ORF type:complete len:267 (-),score=-21.70 gnl/TRDRNA2_/TRDRNA2_176551_c0_seq2:888-1688(-)
MFQQKGSRRLSITIILFILLYTIKTIAPIPGITQSLFLNNHEMNLETVEIKDQISFPVNILMLGISPFITSHLLIYFCVKISETEKNFKSFVDRIPLLGDSAKEIIMARDEGRAGEARMNQIFRRFSLPIMFLESSYLAQICTKKIHDDAVIDWPVGLQYVSLEFSTTLSLMAGSCIAEKIATDISYYGLRDGSLMVICTDILVKIMGEMLTFWRSYIDGGQIKLYQVLVVALTLILSSYTATTLNMAFNNIHLLFTEVRSKNTGL